MEEHPLAGSRRIDRRLFGWLRKDREVPRANVLTGRGLREIFGRERRITV
jgi:hypothetical protein